ncbi:MAG: NUDIX hydrolase [Streptococcaceae bacterium]|jgi:8-oxo-dGTP pyrophosphatase MutT (NUDIX family)|nr:NUDIX hydrolase [Streptococcaceae bacterium]
MTKINNLQILLENYQPQGEQEISDLKIFKSHAADPVSFTREPLAHFTASAIVVNRTHNKILGIFHKIYQSWGWLGGHADGETDLLAVARREVEEESGLSRLTVLLDGQPISIEDLTVAGHVHRTRGYVSAHLHLNVTFLFEADESDLLHKNEAETDGIAWIPIDEFVEKSTEPEMKRVYTKIISRIKG